MEQQYSTQIKKITAICDKICAGISQERLDEEYRKDCKINNLTIDRNKALNKKKFTEAEHLRRMIESRKTTVLNEMLNKIICGMVVSGEIISYFEDEDRAKYEECRARIWLAMDVLDSTFNDLQSMLHSVGMNGEIGMLQSIEKARESIKIWCDTTLKTRESHFLRIILDESDNVYDHLNKRLDIMNRKLIREMKRQDKEKEKQTKNN